MKVTCSVRPKRRETCAGLAHLLGRPEAPLLRIAANSGRALSVEHRVIGRMNGHHLALKVGGKLADRDADVGQLSLDLVAIGLAVVGASRSKKRLSQVGI